LPLRQFQKKIKEEDKNSKSHSVVVSKKYKNQSQNRSQTTANQYAEREKFSCVSAATQHHPLQHLQPTNAERESWQQSLSLIGLDAGQRSFGSGTKTFVGSLTKDDAFTIDSATNVLWHT
jgi:hypothetical protein